MNFVVEYDEVNECDFNYLQDVIPANAIPCHIEGSSLKLIRTDIEKRYLCVYEINPNIKTKIQWCSKRKEYRLYSPHYGWQSTTHKILDQTSETVRTTAKDNPDKQLLLNGAGGFKPAVSKYRIKPTDERISEQYRQQSYPTSNNCVWLAAALVIKSENEIFAEQMIHNLSQYPEDYEWLHLFDKAGNRKSLAFLLRQLDSTQYQAQKLKQVSFENRTNYILNQCAEGLFVVILKSVTGESSHCVGINVKTRKLYDCMEEVVHELTLEGLSYCCGDKQFVKFESICQLVPIGKKNSNKRKK